MKKISFVFPVYYEEENLPTLVNRLEEIKNQLNYEMEVIFVDDYSQDKSRDLINKYCQKYPFVKAVYFSRNFGHQIAISAGIEAATGDAVITMDSDLQDPPEVALELIKKWEEGFDVVYAKRKTRKDPAWKKLTIFIYYRFLKLLANIDIPKDTGDFRLMSKRAADEIRNCPEKSRFLRGLSIYVGFKQAFVLYDRQERAGGQSNYSLKKLIQLALDGIIGFSVVPLRMISLLGLITALLSILGVIHAIIIRIFFPDITIAGWTTIVVAVFFIGGVQMIMLGIIGEYIGRIYIEVRNRPLYIVAKKLNFNENERKDQ